MSKITKALAAAATALGTGIITAAQSDGINVNEWWTILGGTIIAGAAVWAVPNAA